MYRICRATALWRWTERGDWWRGCRRACWDCLSGSVSLGAPEKNPLFREGRGHRAGHDRARLVGAGLVPKTTHTHTHTHTHTQRPTLCATSYDRCVDTVRVR